MKQFLKTIDFTPILKTDDLIVGIIDIVLHYWHLKINNKIKNHFRKKTLLIKNNITIKSLVIFLSYSTRYKNKYLKYFILIRALDLTRGLHKLLPSFETKYKNGGKLLKKAGNYFKNVFFGGIHENFTIMAGV